MRYRKSESGFTLLEILVVITLILIIAGIALPRFIGVSDEGRKAKAAGELRTLQTAMESYLLNTASPVPTTVLALEIALEGATPRLIGQLQSFKDPFGATPTAFYGYFAGGTKYYVIFSPGPDKTPQITGIDATTGNITPISPGDDIFVTNGQLSA